MATIAFQNGGGRQYVHQKHNRRDKDTVSKEDHIDPSKTHENWIDIPEREAYHQLFDEATERYNQRQPRADKKIKDYWSTVNKDSKRHTAYEAIAGVYAQDGAVEYIPEPMAKEILKEFVKGWEDRNPNIKLFGAYYHADEQGQPHVHLDYIPVAHGYERGMDTQAGLKRALEEMGFHKKGHLTPQMQWQNREREVLEGICKSYNLTIEHPQVGQATVKRLKTEIYKLKKEVENLKREAKENIQAIEQQALPENQGFLNNCRGKVTTDREQLNTVLNQAKQSKTLQEKLDQALQQNKQLQDATFLHDREIEKKEKKIRQKEQELAEREDALAEREDALAEREDALAKDERDWFLKKNDEKTKIGKAYKELAKRHPEEFKQIERSMNRDHDRSR